MSELQFIKTTLEQTARRRRLARALRGLWMGLLAGSTLCLLVLAVYKLAPIPVAWLLGTGIVAVLCALIGFILGGWHKASLNETARWVDLRQNLKERLSTALEVSSQTGGSRWVQLIVADAAGSVRGMDPRRLVRFTLPVTARWALLLLLVGAGLGFVPEYRTPKFLQQQADAKHIQETGRQLAELTRHELQQRPPALEVTRKSLEGIAELGDELAKETLTRSEALRDLVSAAEQLKEQLRELSRNPGLKKLEQATRASGKGETQSAAKVQQEIEELQKKLGDQAGQPEVLERLQQNLAKLQQAAKAMKDQSPAGNGAAQEQLSASLAALAQEAQQAGVSLPQLEEALAALTANQADSVMQELEAALNDLEKLRDLAEQLQQLQAQAQKLGKDLAEQLQQGQVAAAAQSLKKLAEQLQSAGLSTEQLQRILQEVSDAVAPAEEYGRLAELLKQGVKQLQQSDKPTAAQSLTAAAKELEDLIQQLADAGALMAALENLETASLCIGTGQGWKLGQLPAPGRGNARGLGNWANENNDWSEPRTWSGGGGSSGTAGTGIGSRHFPDGDPSLKDPLTPTKAKGQFSPGAPMPGITLKGVSLRGQSTVQFAEAVAAAQADAQAALSQEKVPRAYQGTVKEYFDDLKK
ncbi:MAG: hypothetical protein IH623_09070 [Verrucomicrobia bacterium]|nr:hypothetical protein [Verrucomicrobiota bacterium]